MSPPIIRNAQGQQVSLSGLVQVSRVGAAQPIFSQDGHKVVYVLGFSPEYVALA